MKITPASPLPASMVGQDVSLTISAAHSTGPVLAVPEAAVFARADGRLYVTRVTGRPSGVQVPVHVEVTGNGMVGVSPAGGGTLAPGDRVVTGTGYAPEPAREQRDDAHGQAAARARRSSGCPGRLHVSRARHRCAHSGHATWSSTAASTSRSPGRLAPASPPCSTWSACSTGRPRARSRSTAWTWARPRNARRAAVRAHRIGFVFQSFHLLPHRTAVENVMLAQVYADVPRRRRRTARPGRARAGRPGPPGRRAAHRAVRRRAAAGRDRPRPGQPPVAAAVRRADRQPGHAPPPRELSDLLDSPAPGRRHAAGHHAQPGGGRAGAAADHHPRRRADRAGGNVRGRPRWRLARGASREPRMPPASAAPGGRVVPAAPARPGQ